MWFLFGSIIKVKEDKPTSSIGKEDPPPSQSGIAGIY